MNKVEFVPIARENYTSEMKTILDLYNEPNRSDGDEIVLNALKMKASQGLLEQYGQKCKVLKNKKGQNTMNGGMCYGNANEMISKGYQYVEGTAKNKKDDFTFSHAWNVDKYGNYYDFTLENPKHYEYYGIVLEEIVVLKVGFQNGGIHFCILPFIEVKK